MTREQLGKLFKASVRTKRGMFNGKHWQGVVRWTEPGIQRTRQESTGIWRITVADAMNDAEDYKRRLIDLNANEDRG